MLRIIQSLMRSTISKFKVICSSQSQDMEQHSELGLCIFWVSGQITEKLDLH